MYKQPFLLCFGTLQHPGSFFLIVEDNMVPLGENSVIAFQILFASFFIFHLHYPPYIKPLFNFFEQRVFMLTPLSTASIGDFVARLQSICNL
jgi:hypothetical protein